VQVKNRKSVVSGFLTRTVYFNELDEREKYTVRVKKPENVFSCLLTRAVYFNELDEREKYTVRFKKQENVFSVFFLPEPYISASSTSVRNIRFGSKNRKMCFPVF